MKYYSPMLWPSIQLTQCSAISLELAERILVETSADTRMYGANLKPEIRHLVKSTPLPQPRRDLETVNLLRLEKGMRPLPIRELNS